MDLEWLMILNQRPTQNNNVKKPLLKQYSEEAKIVVSRVTTTYPPVESEATNATSSIICPAISSVLLPVILILAPT